MGCRGNTNTHTLTLTHNHKHEHTEAQRRHGPYVAHHRPDEGACSATDAVYPWKMARQPSVATMWRAARKAPPLNNPMSL